MIFQYNKNKNVLTSARIESNITKLVSNIIESDGVYGYICQ